MTSSFYRLLLQPAAVMHASWWKALGVEELQSVYQTTSRAWRSINQLITQRRAWPSTSLSFGSVEDLTAPEQKILGFVEKLPVLIPALGLLRLGRAEYWMLRAHREALPQLSAADRAQLSVLAAPLRASSVPDAFHVELANIPPAQLAEYATSLGAAVLAQTLKGRFLLRAIEILFEPSTLEGPAVDEAVAAFGLNMLFRLARFIAV